MANPSVGEVGFMKACRSQLLRLVRFDARQSPRRAFSSLTMVEFTLASDEPRYTTEDTVLGRGASSGKCSGFDSGQSPWSGSRGLSLLFSSDPRWIDDHDNLASAASRPLPSRLGGMLPRRVFEQMYER